MARLNTHFMGMVMKNPVMAAPGPWTGSAEGLQAAIDAGAGAVMTETISQEVYPGWNRAAIVWAGRYSAPHCSAV